jgi:hypothetical protein
MFLYYEKRRGKTEKHGHLTGIPVLAQANAYDSGLYPYNTQLMMIARLPRKNNFITG